MSLEILGRMFFTHEFKIFNLEIAFSCRAHSHEDGCLEAIDEYFDGLVFRFECFHFSEASMEVSGLLLPFRVLANHHINSATQVRSVHFEHITERPYECLQHYPFAEYSEDELLTIDKARKVSLCMVESRKVECYYK